MNVIVRLEYELAYYDSAVHSFNHYTTRTPPFFLGLPHWIFLYLWHFVIGFMLAKICPSVVLSGAPETLANHSVPTWSVSLPKLYICCLDWLDPPSVQQRHKCFHLWRTLLFSLLSEKLYSSWALFLIFIFIFYRCHKNLSRPDGLVCSLDI